MRKVKVMRIYDRSICDGDNYISFPIVEGFSDWEEISDEEFDILRVYEFNH